MSFHEVSTLNLDCLSINRRAAADVILPPEAGANPGDVLTLNGLKVPTWVAAPYAAAGVVDTLQTSDGAGGFKDSGAKLTTGGNLTSSAITSLTLSSPVGAYLKESTNSNQISAVPIFGISLTGAGTDPINISADLVKTSANSTWMNQNVANTLIIGDTNVQNYNQTTAQPTAVGQAIMSTSTGVNSTTAWALPVPNYAPDTMYVSDIFGSNVTGTGSYAKPFKTINAAFTAAGGAPPAFTVYILDSSTYDEVLVINFLNGCSIIGPGAIIDNSNPGDTITVTNPCVINVGGVSCSGGGKALTTSGTFITKVSMFYSSSGDFVNTSTGRLIIEADLITGAVDNSAALGEIVLKSSVAPVGGIVGVVNAPYFISLPAGP